MPECSRVWWLSFAEDIGGIDTFLGVVLAEGCSITEALRAATAAGQDPGGEVLGLPFPYEGPPPDVIGGYMLRLLGNDEVMEVAAILDAVFHSTGGLVRGSAQDLEDGTYMPVRRDPL